MERKQDFAILAFLTIVFTVIYFSISFERDEEAFQKAMKSGGLKDDVTFFKEANLYVHKQGKPVFSLLGSSATHDAASKVFLVENPVGSLERNGKPIYYRSMKGMFNIETEFARLTDMVFLEAGTTTIQAKSIDLDGRNKSAKARGLVETKTLIEKTGDSVTVHSDFSNYQSLTDLLTYEGQVQGTIQRKRAYEENILFNADKLILNRPKAEANLIGNVSLQKGTIDAKANEGAIYLENYNKRVKYYTLSENVRIVEKVILKDNSVMERKAFADKLEGVVSEEKIILSGNPRVMQGTDKIRGNTILIREKSEVVEVDDASSTLLINKEKK